MHVVLNSFGASLRKEDGQFAAYTAHGKQLLSPIDVQSITISRAAKISSDAVILAIEHEIDIIFVDPKGTPLGRVWSIQYGSISDIRRKQVDFIYSKKAIQWITELISEKINNQAALLTALSPEENPAVKRKLQSVINSLEDYKLKIKQLEGEVISDIAPTLRGWEGASTRKYFQMLAELMPEKYKFPKRSSRPALDPFNALINYGYGIMYGKVEGSLIKAGIDPYVGIFHRDDYNRPALVYDVIERYRIWIDYIVYHLCKHDAFHEECFTEFEDGGIYLEGMGKRILIQSVNDYLAEVIQWNGLMRSREQHIQQDAYKLADTFMKT